MVCTGKEDRLIDCNFPEQFGNATAADASDYDDAVQPASPQSPASAPAPDPGVVTQGRDCTLLDNSAFGVICRRFELTGAPA